MQTVTTLNFSVTPKTLKDLLASAEKSKAARIEFKKETARFADKWALLNGREKASVDAFAAVLANDEVLKELSENPLLASFIKNDIKADSKLALALGKPLESVNRKVDKTPWAAAKVAKDAADAKVLETVAKAKAAEAAAITPLQALENALIADLAAARKISGAHNLAATILDAVLLINPDFLETQATVPPAPAVEAPAVVVVAPKAIGAKRRAAK
jgi:hypothetical protein